jgi:hypothetical protein
MSITLTDVPAAVANYIKQNVTMEVYATVDQASLFPVEQPSKTVKQAFTVQ